eukprot:4610130-Alexandrium_andersonii.AAC.1
MCIRDSECSLPCQSLLSSVSFCFVLICVPLLCAAGLLACSLAGYLVAWLLGCLSASLPSWLLGCLAG